jgi:ABC-2 type transport system permease protein
MPRFAAVSSRNVLLIAQREYFERVRTRSFLITTIMIPLIMALFAVGSIFLGSKTVKSTRIAVISLDTQLALDLQTELQRQRAEADAVASQTLPSSAAPSQSTRPADIVVDAIDPGPNTRAEMDRDLDSGEFDGFLWITPAGTPGGRPTFAFTPKSSAQAGLKTMLGAALSKVLMREQLTHRGIVAADADTMLQPVQIVAAERSHADDTEFAQLSVSLLFFVMYLVIMLYGMNVARSIIEEKTSRIFEVLLATIRPEAMMAGKIIGVGSVGLTQVGIWLGAALLLAGSSMALHPGGGGNHISFTAAQVFFFFVFFILGYLFYASIAAALGAMTNSEQELQQLNMFLVMPLLVCFVLLGSLLSAPDSTLARVLALVPPFTPLLMYLRVSLGHPKVWEVGLSVLLTSASIGAIIWVTSRIYRIGVLMYGKRPSMHEIMRWLKYS